MNVSRPVRTFQDEIGQLHTSVATEVRALADRSREAAKEINELAHSSVGIAENAEERLSRLVPSIQKTSEFVQEISAAKGFLSST